MKNEKIKVKSTQKGITLIALVITIIVLLILAGVTINLTLGDNGIFKTAEQAGIKHEEASAREKLEMALLELQTEKVVNKEYNENEYIDNYLSNNQMIVMGDIVVVDGWQFQIDRNVPKIVSSLGKEDNNKQQLTKKENCIELYGTTYVKTNIQESDFIGEGKEFTIAVQVKINREEQSKIQYMDILGNHLLKNGIVFQFDQYSTNLRLSASEKNVIDYTPYYDKWTNIVVTYKDGKLKSYINNELLAETEEDIQPYGELYIGNGCSEISRSMSGMISAFKLWKKSLSKEEIIQMNLLEERTIVARNAIMSEIIFDSMEDINKVGSIIGDEYEFVPRDESKQERVLKLKGGTHVNTNIQQSDILKDGTGEFTIGIRLKIDREEQKTVNYMDILGNHVGNNGIIFQFNQTSTNIGFCGNTIDYTPYYGKWTDIVYTYNNSNSKVYVNGELISEYTYTVSPYSNLLVGTGFLTENRAMKGQIYSLKVWTKELLQQEISQIDMEKENTQDNQESIKLDVRFKSLGEIEKIGNMQGSNYQFRIYHKD